MSYNSVTAKNEQTKRKLEAKMDEKRRGTFHVVFALYANTGASKADLELSPHNRSYSIIAHDAEEAIKKARGLTEISEGDELIVESVSCICWLDN